MHFTIVEKNRNSQVRYRFLDKWSIGRIGSHHFGMCSGRKMECSIDRRQFFHVSSYFPHVLLTGISASILIMSSKLLERLKIDDPLDVAPVHLFCGLWSTFSVGLF